MGLLCIGLLASAHWYKVVECNARCIEISKKLDYQAQQTQPKNNQEILGVP